MMPQGNWFTVETSSGRKVDIFADKVEFFYHTPGYYRSTTFFREDKIIACFYDIAGWHVNNEFHPS